MQVMSLSVAGRTDGLAGGLGMFNIWIFCIFQYTAWFLFFCNKLSDAFNGKINTDPSSQYRTFLNDQSFHIPFFDGAIKNLHSMRLVNKNTNINTPHQPPTLQNLIFTLQGFKAMWTTLKKLGFRNLKTKNISQDLLENFFCRIHACGASNQKPTWFQFIGHFKTLVINDMTKLHSKGASCIDDKSNFILSYKSYFGFESGQKLISNRQANFWWSE